MNPHLTPFALGEWWLRTSYPQCKDSAGIRAKSTTLLHVCCTNIDKMLRKKKRGVNLSLVSL